MEKIFEARTEQEAVEMAIREFGVNEDFLEVEVLQKSGNALFGSKVKIKASVMGLPSNSLNNEKKPVAQPLEIDYTEKIKNDISEELKEKICVIVQQFIEKMGIAVECKFLLQDNFYVVSLHTEIEDDQNLMIGRHGKNLEAIQNLCNSMILTKLPEFGDYIVIDVEKYRERRTEWLSSIAMKKADYVLRTGKSAMLDELGPFDRKLIHKAIRNVEGVTTQSQGDGYYKRIQLILE